MADVEGGGVHFDLVVTPGTAATAGVTGAMITDEIGDDAFDGGALAEILPEVGGEGVGAGGGKNGAMIADEDLAHVVRGEAVAAAVWGERAASALFGGEAEAATFTAVGAIGGRGDLTVWAGEGETVR